MSGDSPPPAAPAPAKSSSARTVGIAVAAIVVVVIVVVAGLYVAKIGPFAPANSSGATSEVAGGFTEGQVVTFVYTGNYQCTPSLTAYFPNESSITSTTTCEAGAANQTAVSGQVPQWVLVPAFAGLSIFGVASLGANDRGFPQFQGGALPTDCGGGGSPTGCPDHPVAMYSPAFTTVEKFLNMSSGVGGYPEGVLPTPAHDHLLNTSTTFPNVPWGSIVVLVFDPNIWPDRVTGACTARVASSLSSATGNCLTTIAALDSALTTSTTAIATANGGSPGNPIWKAFGGPNAQVVIPGDLTIAQINHLNTNLYIPFSVQPGAPSSFPS